MIKSTHSYDTTDADAAMPKGTTIGLGKNNHPPPTNVDDWMEVPIITESIGLATRVTGVERHFVRLD